MTMLRRTTFVLSALVLPPAAAGAPVWLVTEREATLPPTEDAQMSRAISRGPAVRYLSPRMAAVEAGRPFVLRVAFDGRGESRVDPASIRVTLLRGGRIDLTGRLRAFLSPSGIDMPEALAPAGRHMLRIEVADDQGRRTMAVIDLDVR